VVRTYGMTETCSQLCTQPYATAGTVQDGVGPPVSGAELRVDGGRILARGPMLMSGYLDGSPPPLDADGWLDTGDRGALDERGWLHVAGRGDDTIISGGENVHPAEVEATLVACPEVAAACAFAAPDPTWGQIVAAAVVPRGDGPAALEAIDRAARASLAPFKRPRRLYLVDALPLGPSGKVDRQTLARRLVTGDHDAAKGAPA
jgi:acyl-CoA synthetase (AMP-forming)/AMP-acid ligase II